MLVVIERLQVDRKNPALDARVRGEFGELLVVYRARLRGLKAWIKTQRQANRDGGEWALLMRAREFLDTIVVDEAANPPTLDAMQRLIDDIDRAVPEWWRKKKR